MKLFTILRNIASGIKTSFTRLTSLETWQSSTVDYVVDQGTATASDGSKWFYKKWASGVAECVGSKTETKSQYNTMGSSYGMWWEYWSDVYYPFTFTEKPNALANAVISSAFTLTTVLDAGIYVDHVRVYSAVHNTSGSLPVTSTVYVIGKWK